MIMIKNIWEKWGKIILVYASLPLLVLYLGIPLCIEEYKLDYQSEIVSGKLIQKTENYDYGKYFNYEYTVGTVRYQRKRKVDQDCYKDHQESDVITVEYLPDNPYISRPKGMMIKKSTAFYFILIVTVFTSIILGNNFRNLQKHSYTVYVNDEIKDE